jgi:hypothetical protein
MTVVSGSVGKAFISMVSATGTSGGGAGSTTTAVAMAVPQALQNLALRLFSVWHLLQGRLLSALGAGVTDTVRRSWPQPLQNFALSIFSVAHFEHEIAMSIP